jgi:hypothetical protein
MSLFFSCVFFSSFDDVSGEDLQDFAAIHIVRLGKVVNLLFICVYCGHNIKFSKQTSEKEAGNNKLIRSRC